MVIQQLLRESGATDFDPGLVVVEPAGLEVAADWRTLRSPETYLGYRQATGFASEDASRPDTPLVYSAAPRLPLNTWDLSGTWTFAGHASVLQEPGGRIAFQFQARDVNLVMGPAARGAAIPFSVFLDGELVATNNGTDVDAGGGGTVRAQETYQLVRQRGEIRERRFEIEFHAGGLEAYCFTFG